MHVSESPAARVAGAARALPMGGDRAAIVAVAALTAVGVAIRVGLVGESVFADELSTYWIVSENGLRGVLTTVHGNGEITPPLYFVLSWLTTRVDLSPEWLRAPSLVAGAAAIPLTYLLGLRTVGRRAGMLAAALVTLSPFMVYYSVEARGYELAIVLVLLSTLALLAGVENGRRRWWVAYGVCTCAAVYTHYTAVFALGAQLVWLWWAHPEARKPALLANAAAVAGFLPWLSGLINDFQSPTTKILSQLEPFNLDNIGTSLGHASVGYPYSLVPLRSLPGDLALVLVVSGLVLAIAGMAIERRFDRPRPRLVLLLALVVATPVGEALVSAVGANVFGTRNLAIAWPPFAVALAALLLAAGPRLRYLAAALVIASFGIGAAKMLESRFQRPDYEAAASFVDRSASGGDVVIDATGVSPAPISAMDVALTRPHRLLYVRTARIQYNPFRFLPAPSPAQVAHSAVTAAAGGPIFLISGPVLGRLVMRALPAGYRAVETREYPGFLGLSVLVYARRASTP